MLPQRRYRRDVLLGLVTVGVSALLTGAAAWLGWWASGGGLPGVVPGLLLGGLAAAVTFGLYVPFAFSVADAGSIRSAERALREAQREGRPLSALRARARLHVVRWQRR